MRRPWRTRQDHIDPQVVRVEPCGAARLAGLGRRDTVVLFRNGTGACSSGHVMGDYDELPTLRRPEDDPMTWVRHNADKVAQMLVVGPCAAHGDGDGDDDWGWEGHLWAEGHHRALRLCLPETVRQ